MLKRIQCLSVLIFFAIMFGFPPFCEISIMYCTFFTFLKVKKIKLVNFKEGKDECCETAGLLSRHIFLVIPTQHICILVVRDKIVYNCCGV